MPLSFQPFAFYRMASNKPLIIPWLIGKINSQMYPGVEWVNNEKTQFKIPWKHGKKQSEDDIKIFKVYICVLYNFYCVILHFVL